MELEVEKVGKKVPLPIRVPDLTDKFTPQSEKKAPVGGPASAGGNSSAKVGAVLVF